MQKFSAPEYLKIDIANSFGLDKEDWDVRLKWFDDNAHQINDLLNQAEDPALYFAGLQAWDCYLRGVPSGYPISLDATASGMQLLACITGDRLAASICNVVDAGKRMDAYTAVYDRMVFKLVNQYQQPAGGIERSDAKQAVMTSLYGSEAMPKEVFGEGLQLNVFYETMGELAPGAWELNQHFLDIWDPTATMYSWVLPDNFHVHTKVMDKVTDTVHFLNRPYEIVRSVAAPTEKGRSLGANSIHSLDGMVVREIGRRCNYDVDTVLRVITVLNRETDSEVTDNVGMAHTLWSHYLRTGFLSARILDYIDSYTIGMMDREVITDLVLSLPAKPFRVISVHDCFRVLPNYGNDLREQYNLILHKIAKSNILSDLLTQLVGHKVEISPLDPTMADEILHSNYALS
ncbi:RNA polymerase, single-subunit [Stenotrophomonas phage Philippe]|uniref:DNA-directed RNA polymerase n=1 Tax=Stenotrophomonas phage Philippe TaxID=2859655 RepID=A0AAE7WMI4_9CAUD|nr:RNA polymerase, single-subunit [Stenotrophomonas phage Philippe]QYW02226.1 RNA polymerase, single-subunit [Stenotrophomonas phage Philippe]